MHAGTGSFPHFERSLLLQNTVGMQLQTGSDISPCWALILEKKKKKKKGKRQVLCILFEFRHIVTPPINQNSSCGTKFSFSDRQMTRFLTQFETTLTSFTLVFRHRDLEICPHISCPSQLKPKQQPESLKAHIQLAAESRESQRLSTLPKMFHENRKGRVFPERALRGGHRFLIKTQQFWSQMCPSDTCDHFNTKKVEEKWNWHT